MGRETSHLYKGVSLLLKANRLSVLNHAEENMAQIAFASARGLSWCWDAHTGRVEDHVFLEVKNPRERLLLCSA